MKMKKKLSSKGENQILISTNVATNLTQIGSNYSAWDSLFVALEGVAVLVKLANKEGVSMKKISEKMNRQLSQALADYKITFSHKL